MEDKKYIVVKPFKSHCCCEYVYEAGDVWSLHKMTSKKRAYIAFEDGALHKVKLSRALTNSKVLE